MDAWAKMSFLLIHSSLNMQADVTFWACPSPINPGKNIIHHSWQKGNCVPDFHMKPSLWLQLRMLQLFHSIKSHRTAPSLRSFFSILFYQLKEKENESHWKGRWKRSIRSSAPSLPECDCSLLFTWACFLKSNLKRLRKRIFYHFP